MFSSNQELIDNLISEGYLKNPLLIEAFLKIDRKEFAPKDLENEAYGNYPLPIGFGQTISQPLTVAFMLELLEPKPEEKVLDVGCGSGWQTGLLAYIVSRVVGIERIPELKKKAEENVSKFNFLGKGTAEIILGDGSEGYPKEAPYDKIIAGADVGTIPDEWKKQLKIGGKIVCPAAGSIMVLDKTTADEFEERKYFGFSFVPLIRG